jgi:tetratricopeptide (TPR) repeat protein
LFGEKSPLPEMILPSGAVHSIMSTRTSRMSQQTDFASPETADATRGVAEAIAVADYQRAYELAQTALTQGLIHPTFFNARALWLERQNRDEEALADFERALSLAPRNTVQLNAIGLCLTRLYRLEEAIAAFDEAVRLSPTAKVSRWG